MPFRLRVCYGKTGPLRFLGHLEIGGALERAVRRARLPVEYGHGFHPKAKLAFGPALPVGVAGEREYVDLSLADWVPPEDARDALSCAMPDGLPVRAAKYVSPDAPSLTVDAAVVVFEVELVGLDPEGAPELAKRLEELSGRDTVTVEKRGAPKTYDLTRTLLRSAKLIADREPLAVELWLRMSDQTTIRPEALLGEIAAPAGEWYMRASRMECYAERPEGLIALSEVP